MVQALQTGSRQPLSGNRKKAKRQGKLFAHLQMQESEGSGVHTQSLEFVHEKSALSLSNTPLEPVWGTFCAVKTPYKCIGLK